MADKRGVVAPRRHTQQVAAQAQFQEVFLGLQAWRALHPQAQFAAIEAEVDRRLNHLRAQLLADLALASAATDVTPAACCPGCGGPLRDEGPRQRTVVTVGQARVTLDRAYAA